MGRSEPKGGIAAFDRLVWQVMTKEPYASAPRVFWIVDNGSDHRGKKSIDTPPEPLAEPDPRPHPGPRQLAQPGGSTTRSSSARFSDPSDFQDTAAVARALNDFERHYNQIAEPFEWNFTHDKLADLVDHLDQPEQNAPPLSLAA